MRTTIALFVLSFGLLVAACGPSDRVGACTGESCNSGACEPGQVRECYTGQEDTKGVGPCAGGEQRCNAAGQWGNCDGEIVPVGEVCGDGIDQNCNGTADEDEDRDGDGFTTCEGDCCDSTECGSPNLANPGAFDAPGNNVDDDCDMLVDNTTQLCDQGLVSNSSMAADYARAMDICQSATLQDKKWGVLSATLTLPDGMGVPEAVAHSIRNRFGSKVMPRGGVSMAVFSTGHAAGKGDTNPPYNEFVSYSGSTASPLPADFLAANNDSLPNAPGCPEPMTPLAANDSVMLTVEVRVPTNARSFSLKTNFYSAEFPEFTCSRYNDFFVVLLDSMHTGMPENPADKNLAFYTAPGTTMNYPVGVNLAHGNTGLFPQCVNGETGCSGTPGTISTCISTDDLMQTGFDESAPYDCESGQLEGGATGWLTTSGNVVPGETIKLRVAIWDTSDHLYDSLALVDGFQWSIESTQPGTIILREDQPGHAEAVDAPPQPASAE